MAVGLRLQIVGKKPDTSDSRQFDAVSPSPDPCTGCTAYFGHKNARIDGGHLSCNWLFLLTVLVAMGGIEPPTSAL